MRSERWVSSEVPGAFGGGEADCAVLRDGASLTVWPPVLSADASQVPFIGGAAGEEALLSCSLDLSAAAAAVSVRWVCGDREGEADSATEPAVAEWAAATGLVAMARLAAARAEARRARR